MGSKRGQKLFRVKTGNFRFFFHYFSTRFRGSFLGQFWGVFGYVFNRGSTGVQRVFMPFWRFS